MKDKNRITIRHPHKKEFFVELAKNQETAQTVLSHAINNYIKKGAKNDNRHNRQ